MKLTFLGTRGEIDSTSRRHRRHSSLRVAYRAKEVVIDLGEDWRGRLDEVDPRAVVVTHAHPDHVEALREGAPCPVYATEAAWERMKGWPRSTARSFGRATAGGIGHAWVKEQLDWCAEEEVPRMIVTHCGSQIVKGDERSLGPRLDAMAAKRGVAVGIAHDGMETVLR